MIHIAILDDDRMLVDSIVRFLDAQPDFSCILKAYSLGSFFEALSEESLADVLLLDISLGLQNSLEHLHKIKRLLPTVKIVVMTGHDEKEYLVQALQEGADSYYLKSSTPEHLINTIITTYEGGSYLDPKAAKDLVAMFRKGLNNPELLSTTFPAKLAKDLWALNRRELQVAEGLFLEKSYKEIAQQNNISLDTVRHYLKVLYKKADVHNRTQLISKLRKAITS